MSMASVAWLMSEVHNTDRKDEDDRANPDPNGGLFLGNDWRRFHDQNNHNVIIRFLRISVKFREGLAVVARILRRLAASSR
jgi:hypothetical protein